MFFKEAKGGDIHFRNTPVIDVNKKIPNGKGFQLGRIRLKEHKWGGHPPVGIYKLVAVLPRTRQEGGEFSETQCPSNRCSHGAGLSSSHAGRIQDVPEQRYEGITKGMLRKGMHFPARIRLRAKTRLSNTIWKHCFRFMKMDEVSGTIRDLISDAANKGVPPGRIRRDVVTWCLGNLASDSSAMQAVIKRSLRETLNTRLISYDKSSLVQAVRIKEIVPYVADPGESCLQNLMGGCFHYCLSFLAVSVSEV